jgi:hypothetical protein
VRDVDFRQCLELNHREWCPTFGAPFLDERTIAEGFEYLEDLGAKQCDRQLEILSDKGIIFSLFAGI